MHKVFLPIDTKSLYLNIFNDNEKGHTCTVATPIKQGSSTNEELSQIYKIPCQIDFQKHADLVDQLVKNSKSVTKINNVFVFSKLKVNGKLISTSYSYCMFIKQEIDPQRAQFGRIKLHYPIGIKHEELGINNKKVMEEVSAALNDYAFIVTGFEFDFDDQSLNFCALVVGYNQIPYSKVFINSKGTGNKYIKVFSTISDDYDFEITHLKKTFGELVNPENYHSYMEKGREKAKHIITNRLQKEGNEKICDLKDQYPYSIYDYSFEENGIIKYAIIKFTFSNTEYIEMSSEEMRFLALFPECTLFLIINIGGEPIVREYKSRDLDFFGKTIKSVMLMK